MALSVFFLQTKGFRQLSWGNLLLGGLCGLIFSFKHNIGIFWAVICFSFIFLRSLREGSKAESNFFLHAIFSCYIAFGIYFCWKIRFFDEFLFYILPFLGFWGISWRNFHSHHGTLDVPFFIREVFLFVTGFLPIPLYIFVSMAQVFGFENYFFSLFGMGFQFIHIWDYGILNIFSREIFLPNSISLWGVYSFFVIFSQIAVWYLIPAILNYGYLLLLLRNPKEFNFEETLRKLEYFGLSIMGAFLLFPLEGFHILSSKMFIFILPAVEFRNLIPLAVKRGLKAILILIFIPILISLSINLRAFSISSYQYSDQDRIKRIELPMARRLVQVFDPQIERLYAKIGNEPFYVIDSTGNLMCLLGFLSNPTRQIYLEMRKGILSKEVVDKISLALEKETLVLVNQYDWNRFQDGCLDDLFLNKILEDVVKNFDEKEHLKIPPNVIPSRVPSIVILRRKTKMAGN
ncbi:MAG: hypothetical protein ACD_50C00370G0002 [uncultured bacterium]|nr:MAG: hypothetical protein ACD_50C00370G0002 [uncultured bacterium]